MALSLKQGKLGGEKIESTVHLCQQCPPSSRACSNRARRDYYAEGWEPAPGFALRAASASMYLAYSTTEAASGGLAHAAYAEQVEQLAYSANGSEDYAVLREVNQHDECNDFYQVEKNPYIRLASSATRFRSYNAK